MNNRKENRTMGSLLKDATDRVESYEPPFLDALQREDEADRLAMDTLRAALANAQLGWDEKERARKEAAITDMFREAREAAELQRKEAVAHADLARNCWPGYQNAPSWNSERIERLENLRWVVKEVLERVENEIALSKAR